MIPFFRKITRPLCVVFAVLMLSGCGMGQEKETTPPTLEPIVLPTAPKETEATVAPELQEEHLSVVMDAGDLYTLDYYPNLKTVDLSGSSCYSAIMDFASKPKPVAPLLEFDIEPIILEISAVISSVPCIMPCIMPVNCLKLRLKLLREV